MPVKRCQYVFIKGDKAGKKCGRNCRYEYCKDHNSHRQEYATKLNADKKTESLNKKIQNDNKYSRTETFKLELTKRTLLDDLTYIRRQYYGCMKAKNPNFKVPDLSNKKDHYKEGSKEVYAQYLANFKPKPMVDIKMENEILLLQNQISQADFDKLIKSIYKKDSIPQTFEAFHDEIARFMMNCDSSISFQEACEWLGIIPMSDERDYKVKKVKIIEPIEYQGKLVNIEKFIRQLRTNYNKVVVKIKMINAILKKREEEDNKNDE